LNRNDFFFYLTKFGGDCATIFQFEQCLLLINKQKKIQIELKQLEKTFIQN